MRLLVTGGAGYIGSVVVRRLREAGHATVILDDLSAGHRAAVDPGAEFVQGDFGDRALLAGLLDQGTIDGVVHLAASSLVGESVQDPAKYYRNNLERSLALLDTLREHGVARFVLSSTAAVYGEPVALPMNEDHPTHPTNPYGDTKLALEKALLWYHAAHRLSFVSLRYFNAAGATADGRLGEDHDPETHLVPNVLRAALSGEPVPVFGTDYATPDGTAVRDYIHVEDLADAHVRALERLEARGGASIYNLGNGSGFSVLQVIEAARRVTGRPVPVREASRRPGDPETLVAAADRAHRDLGWRPRSADLETILETAWRFLRAHPHGYES
ncbi:MAG TPA: UDP-glucose 4-epimerase GalE [Candidatus Polarisedimenticolia bacterium]|nr:UDP-glucose 4-epimerase GalE [Candidatus Polarisedimenticolia bacterium]